jgi:hypothetical protein
MKTTLQPTTKNGNLLLGGGLLLAFLALLLIINLIFIVPLKALNIPDYGNDMGYFWAASRTVFLGGNPYDATPGSLYQQIRMAAGGDPTLVDPFKNPHYFTLLFSPLALFDLRLAAGLWTLVQQIMLAGTVIMLIRATGNHITPVNLLLGIGLALLLRYTLLVMMVGNLSLLLLFACTASFYLARTGRPYAAGMCAGLLLVKPQVTFLIIPLLLVAPLGDEGWQNKHTLRRFIGFGITGLIFASYSFSFQPGWVGDWLRVIFAGDVAYFNNTNINREMASLRGIVALFSNDGTAVQVLSIGLALPIWLGLGWLWWRKRNDAAFYPYLLGLAVCANVLTSPYARDYDFCQLIFSLLLAFFTLRRQEREGKPGRFRYSTLLWLFVLLPYALQFVAIYYTRAFEVIIPAGLALILWAVWRRQISGLQTPPTT